MSGVDELRQAGRVVKKITDQIADDEKSRAERLRRDLAESIEVLNKSGISKRYYVVNYRISSNNSKGKGSSSFRRSTLVDMIRDLEPFEHHTSTSAWLVKVPVEKATHLLDFLRSPIDESMDFISALEITDNRASIGDAELQS